MKLEACWFPKVITAWYHKRTCKANPKVVYGSPNTDLDFFVDGLSIVRKAPTAKNNVKPWCLEEFKLSFLKELAVNGCLIRKFERRSWNPTLFFRIGEFICFLLTWAYLKYFCNLGRWKTTNSICFSHLEVEKIRSPIFVPLCSTEEGPP